MSCKCLICNKLKLFLMKSDRLPLCLTLFKKQNLHLCSAKRRNAHRLEADHERPGEQRAKAEWHNIMIHNYLDNASVQIVCSLQDLRKVVSECLAEYAAARSESREEQQDKMLPTDEVRELFKVKPVTLWRWAKCGYLHPVKVGGKLFYDEAEIQKLLNKESKK